MCSYANTFLKKFHCITCFFVTIQISQYTNEDRPKWSKTYLVSTFQTDPDMKSLESGPKLSVNP